MEQKNKLHYSKQKGQGALEYLLIIGGAVLIAAIVLVVMTASGTAGKNTATGAQNVYTNKSEVLKGLAAEASTELLNEEFDSATNYTGRWSELDVAAGTPSNIIQLEGTTLLGLASKPTHWGTYTLTKAGILYLERTFPRTDLLELEVILTLRNNADIIVGFKNSTIDVINTPITPPPTAIPTTEFIHSIKIKSGNNISVLENGTETPNLNASNLAVPLAGGSYRIKIVTKANGGAKYYVTDTATENDVLRHDSTGPSDSPFRPAIIINTIPTTSVPNDIGTQVDSIVVRS